MKEATLLKVALTASIVGIMGLFLLSETVSVEETAISKLDGMEDRQAHIHGTVKRVAERGNVTFLTIEKLEETTVVLFHRDTDAPGRLEEGDEVAVVGKVSDYDGKLEIVADRIQRLR